MMILEHSMPTSLIWIVVVVAVGVTAFTFWRFMSMGILNFVLAALRAIFILLMVWCLFVPTFRRTLTQMLKPRFVVALDISRSMTLSPSEDISNRWDTAQKILEQPWTKIVGSECEIDAYSFSSEVGPKVKFEALSGIPPEGVSTLLRDSLHKLTDRYNGQNVAGLLLLTDGLDTREATDNWSKDPLHLPIFTVRLEPDVPWKKEPDIAVDAVNTPRRITMGWESELKTVISGQNTDGQPLNISLFKDDVLLQELPTQIPASGGAKEVTFHLEHPVMGVFTYRVLANPLAGEIHTNDNEYAVSVQVIGTKNRLLYVESTPRWESKFLTRALKANKQISPLTFLRGPDGKFMTFGTRESMTTDMTESQLAFFKIIILGNLDAEELGKQRAQNLLKFVETGGSLIILGGSKAWGVTGLLHTSLKNILPIKDMAPKAIEGQFVVQLTAEGRSHPAFAGDPSLWEAIPPVLSIFPQAALSPGALALVSASTEQGLQPIVVVQLYGQGKVVAILTDSMWKWVLTPDENKSKPYQRFWDQLLVWLSPSEKEIAPEQLDMFADREQLFLGEEVELSAIFGGRKEKQEEGVSVTCEISTPDKRVIPFPMDKQYVVTSGKSFPGFAVKFPAQLPGLHMAKAVSEIDGKKIMSDPVSFFVKPFTPESAPRPSNFDVLKALASNSSGRYFDSIEDLNEGLCSLQFANKEEETVKYTSLWQNWQIIACLLAFLSVEWGIRKWRNMP